jgi:hypothetical protein
VPPPPACVAPARSRGEGMGASDATPSLRPPSPVPKIPNFGHALSLGAMGPIAEDAVRPPSPVPRIPNFGRALSNMAAASAAAPKPGSLSARDADRPDRFTAESTADLERRRPLTARPAELGLTPRGRAMVGPRPHDRSMRGMDDLLGRYRAAPALTPRTPREQGGLTPRSPRGAGPVPRRGATEDCAPRSPRTAGRTRHKAGPAAIAGGDWLAAAVDAALGDDGSGAWLERAVGATVAWRVGGAGERSPARRHGMLVGEVSGSARSEWLVREKGGADALAVPCAALCRVPPGKGERARVVMGGSCGLEGVVLSVERQLAVLKPAANRGADAQRVRVLPVDCLCRIGAGA